MQVGKSGQNTHFKLTREHVKLAIEKTPKLGFLKKVVEDIPKLDVTLDNDIVKKANQKDPNAKIE